jgi:hypothetical protein
MNYKKCYDLLIEKAQERAKTRTIAKSILGYCEGHHILPLSMKGKTIKENIVFLSAREHFIAHQLLVKIYPNNPGLVQALARLLYDKQGNRLNGKSYDWIKKAHSRYMSESQKGQTKETSERVRKSALSQTGVKKPWVSENFKGRTKEDTLWLMEQSISRTGQSKETSDSLKKSSDKQKGRTKATHSGIAKSANSRTGHRKETHQYLQERSDKYSILSQYLRDELVLRKDSGKKFTEILQWLLSIGIKIGYTALPQIYRKEKNKIVTE